MTSGLDDKRRDLLVVDDDDECLDELLVVGMAAAEMVYGRAGLQSPVDIFGTVLDRHLTELPAENVHRSTTLGVAVYYRRERFDMRRHGLGVELDVPCSLR